jgi:4-amino-4-deoxy-L-arabinose transferase-like glycosyltransferase
MSFISRERLLERDGLKWLALIIFASIIFFVNLGSDGIYSAQEGRAAIVAQNMLDSGNWLHISIKGGIETEKPILCYWFYALSGYVFGVNEFSVRLPSVIAAIATVLMSCWLGIRIYGKQTGFLAGFILASMIGFINLGRLARIDIVLCAFYTASMLFLYTGFFEKKKANWHLYIFYLILALSVMVKGPVSVVLVGITVIALVIKDKDPKILWQLKPFSGLAIGLAINAPWYIYENFRTGGAFAQDFFLNQNISRFTGIGMTYCEGKRKSMFYYIPKLFAGTLPWSLLVPFAFFNFRKKFLKFKPATYYLIIWFSVVFVFFSLAAVKRGDYVLPLYPAIAILLARYLHWIIQKSPKLHKKWVIGWAVLPLAGIIAAAGVKSGLLNHIGSLAAQDKIPHISERDGMSMVQISDIINANFIWAVLGLAIVIALIFWLCKQLERGKIMRVVNAFLIIFMLFICVYYLVLDPAQNKYKTVKYFCARSQPKVPANAKICYYVEWITEAVFFMKRNYEHKNKISDIYDEKTGQILYDFIVTEPRVYDNDMPAEVKAKLLKIEETIPDHQYSLVLLKKK